jgi:hypothetical protein
MAGVDTVYIGQEYKQLGSNENGQARGELVVVLDVRKLQV